MGLFVSLQCVKCECYLTQTHQPEDDFPHRVAGYLCIDATGLVSGPFAVLHVSRFNREYPTVSVDSRVFKPVVSDAPARLIVAPDWSTAAQRLFEEHRPCVDTAPCAGFDCPDWVPLPKHLRHPTTNHRLDCPFIRHNPISAAWSKVFPAGQPDV